ncbi:MAG: cytochrome c oxidase assembly protein subunit 15 [Candidatus Latescibacterota bacterium]|jgi:cytochrome c oxidase assembly protein subunit 15
MNHNRQIAYWLLFVCTLITILIVFGGWVRLTRSGLSIVEWNVLVGVVPPLNENAWQNEFAKYQQSPEYQQVNSGMALDEFKFIYHMEFWHRFLGRIAGLSYVIPLFFFLLRGAIARERIPAYLGIGLLFALQGLVGWLMVKSGLVDRPSVSHLSLTLHLSCALMLLAACLWLAFDYLLPATQKQVPIKLRRLSVLFFLALCVQIAAGGLVAGLKAGYLSDTFPLMFGQIIPDGLWAMTPTITNLFDNPALVHFQHRWFAFSVLGLAIALSFYGRDRALPSLLRTSTRLVLIITLLQVALGIGTVLGGMPIFVASLHQAVAVALFSTSLFACHRAYS